MTTEPYRPQHDPLDALDADLDAVDHCLVHHFIRAHGRRPTRPELDDLRARASESPRVPGPRHAAAPAGLARSWRREVARLVHRI